MSQYANLQKNLQLDGLVLKNRVLMASLTRNRGIVPNQTNIEYYTQRAGAGLIFYEGLLVEPQGTEWLEAPGIWSEKQIVALKKVTDAVHAKGGLIFAQLWHLGRAAHTLHNRGVPPPAPSAIPAKGAKFRLLEGQPDYPVPEAIDDPKQYIQLFKSAAEKAKRAGFDGVELLGGCGYLPQQFLESHSNHRTDEYGGSIENRARFTLEIIDELVKVFPRKRVGIKLTPGGGYNHMGEDTKEQIVQLYSHLIQELDQRDIGHIQLGRYLKPSKPTGRGMDVDIQEFRPFIKKTYLFANGEFTAEEGDQYIAEGKADAIVYGRPYIINPDLEYRFFNGIAVNETYDFGAFYNFPEGQPQKGYSDYPTARA